MGSDHLAARWRRLDAAVAALDSAAGSDDPFRCPDAVAAALDSLYDVWEVWTSRSAPTAPKANDAVRGDPEGETAAALVHARGAKTHDQVEFGDFTDTIAESFYDHWGCWRWQAHSDPTPRFAERDSWYQAHVANHEVHPPFEAAVRWLRRQLNPPAR